MELAWFFDRQQQVQVDDDDETRTDCWIGFSLQVSDS